MPIVAILVWPAEGQDMRAEYGRVADELNGGRPLSSPADGAEASSRTSLPLS